MNDTALPIPAPVPAAPPSFGGRLLALAATHARLLRYLLIGGGAVLIDLGVFALLATVFEVPPLLANTVSVAVSIVYSYLVNALANFKVRDRMLLRFLSFALVSGAGYLVSTGLLWLLVDVVGLDPILAKALTLPVVVALQYGLNTRITFGAALAGPAPASSSTPSSTPTERIPA